MTDAFLALVPTYGLWLVFGAVFIACLGVPAPASILVLTAGAFAAAENFALWQVLAVTFAAFVLGDQAAYALGHRLGGPLVTRAKAWPQAGPLVMRGEALVENRGTLAVLISHTIIAQIGPYVTYICGANAMVWRQFTLVAMVGALIWTGVYACLGYMFATQLTQIMSVLSNFGLLILSFTLLALFGRYLYKAWQRFDHASSD